MVKPRYTQIFHKYHEKYVLIAIRVPSRRMESTTVNNSGDVKIVGNNSVRNHALNKNKSGKNLLVANKAMLTLPRSTDEVPSGYSDNLKM